MFVNKAANRVCSGRQSANWLNHWPSLFVSWHGRLLNRKSNNNNHKEAFRLWVPLVGKNARNDCLSVKNDTVWNCGLTCKLLRLLPDRHMVQWSWNRLAIAVSPSSAETANGVGYDASRTTSDRDPSCRFLFNKCISDLPTTVSRKYALHTVHMLMTKRSCMLMA